MKVSVHRIRILHYAMINVWDDVAWSLEQAEAGCEFSVIIRHARIDSVAH